MTYLFGLLEPFLRRLSREDAFEALHEAVAREFLSVAQVEGIMELWAAADLPGAQTKGKRMSWRKRWKNCPIRKLLVWLGVLKRDKRRK